ncbi:phosphotriesterase-related protein-like isoform X2 [Linepithema humile]|uniref:phosphotriesterase-related protein-like isoform X2 n=1 Tax=Linepithema humile TaxID=83485 RepID=UPI00351E2D43
MASLPVESVETVMGAKPLSELGVTLTHEHLASNFFPCYMPSPFKDINPRVTLCNLAVTRQKPLTIFKNTCLYDESGMRSFYYDISDFKMSGGKTIVDTGSYGMRRNFRFLHTICRTTKINVLVGTDFAQRSIAATGRVQEQVRCPVSFTPAFNTDAPAEILRIYQEAGGDVKKAVISHVDCVFNKKTKFFEFLDDTKCYVQFSLFGFDRSIYPESDCNVLSDTQRIRRITIMKEENLLDRVLMSHDIHTKDRMVSYGGYGYSFIMKYIVPYMIEKKDFTSEEIEDLIISNPKRWLTRG